ncbi:hypothetical protein [Paraburkholderia humisilvae]|uniref:Uncharacterized protein n=2 Tax=Paraburkholderia humisilvae TaxID=627669 RepID=A0A6J5D3Y0_9BURK|nr:hypothetical protein [Paraburkholderia humisilvae]CAB3747326.1 hypothetical protein LMG29542_00406 [Paraburkholderia humisilvae]
MLYPLLGGDAAELQGRGANQTSLGGSALKNKKNPRMARGFDRLWVGVEWRFDRLFRAPLAGSGYRANDD